MRRTQHHNLIFNEYGDIYRASHDLETMTIVDNQLLALSKIVGDGVLSGWNLSCTGSPAVVLVSPGKGFIRNIVTATLSFKTAPLPADATVRIYMRSNAFDPTIEEGLQSGIEGPLAPLEIDPGTGTWKSVLYENTSPPADPTSVRGQAVFFDTINLFWDANTEGDLDHYEIQRSTDASFTTIEETLTSETNGVFPDLPFVDADLTGSTSYHYRIRAVDTSGNASGYTLATQIDGITPQPIVTPANTTKPGEASDLRLFGSDGHTSIIFEESLAEDVTGYLISIQKVDLIGVAFGPIITLSESLSTTRLASGLDNYQRYRITVQTKNVPGNLSTGISADITPMETGAPDEISGLTATPVTGGVALAWTASPDVAKDNYQVTVFRGSEEEESFPVDVGLAVDKTITGFSRPTEVGVGPLIKLEVDQSYLFRVRTANITGTRSAGIFVKGQIIDDVPPKNPSTLVVIPGDAQVTATWRESPSADVVSYLFAFRVDGGPFTEFSVGNTTSHVLTGVPNDSEIEVRIKAVDDASLTSSGVLSLAVVPTADITAPVPPDGMRAQAGDEQVELIWNASVEEDFDHFEVMRRRIIATDANRTTQDLELDTSFDPNHPFPVQIFDVGDATDILDLKLTNGKFYAYNVRAIDTTGNIGIFSETHIIKPAAGVNVERAFRRLLAPTEMDAVYVAATESIKVTWEYWYPAGEEGSPFNETTFIGGKATYPSDGPTSFNIYRSDLGSLIGFELIASVDAENWEYDDTFELVDGTEYFYAVSAVRDPAEVIVDATSVAPADSVLLGTIKVTSGVCESITSQKRIVDQLDATLRDETNARIRTHKHSATPINAANVETNRNISMVDILDLADACFEVSTTGDDSFTCGDTLSPAANAAYTDLIVAGTTVEERQAEFAEGIEITETFLVLGALQFYTYYVTKFVFKDLNFAVRQAFVIDPRTMTWGFPRIGDFQVLVNNEEPTVPFSIDRINNILIFEEPLPANAFVTLDGLGFSYYIPAKIDNEFRGFRVLVNGTEDRRALVDETDQVVRFNPAIDLTSVVTVEIEPPIPDFGTQTQPRQVSLSPSIVLNDLVNQDGRVFKSTSGAWGSDDVVFPIDENGDRISGFTIDFENRQVILDEPILRDAVLALEIRGKPEVQGSLPTRRLGGIDGSVFSSGEFIKPQLPEISHEGRIKERANPLFTRLISGNNYTYSRDEITVGSATTVYSALLLDGKLLLGSSTGIYFSRFGTVLLGEDDNFAVDPNQSLNLIDAGDEVVVALSGANRRSGYFNGILNFELVSGSIVRVSNPSLVELTGGDILIAGGLDSPSAADEAYLYDVSTQKATAVATMLQGRWQHSLVRLSDGRVLAAGGLNAPLSTSVSEETFDALFPQEGGIVGSSHLSSVEIYDSSLNTWSSAAAMPERRTLSGTVLLDDGRILLSGGQYTLNILGDTVEGYIKFSPEPGEEFGSYIDRQTENRERTSAILYDSTGDSWTADENMGEGGVVVEVGIFDGTPFFDLDETRQLYDVDTGTWTEGVKPATTSGSSQTSGVEVTEPIKQFFLDSRNRLFAIGREVVYISYDKGSIWIETDGLEGIGVCHYVTEAFGVMYAATDLGVYVMTDSRDNVWIQGGLIGAGTTETFDLLEQSLFYPNGDGVLAATEIGLFFSSDLAQTWTRISPTGLENIRNVEPFGEDTLYITAGQEVWKTTNRGMTWSRTGRFPIIDEATRLVARGATDLFLGTAEGLYHSIDGIEFDLVDFDLNRDGRLNAVQFIGLVGDDLCVTYDLTVFLLGPDLIPIKVAEFDGVLPTVRDDDIEQRHGYRYDVASNEIIFEFKRFLTDVISIATDYSLYALSEGPWHAQNPSAPILVFINAQETNDFTSDPFVGTVAFAVALTKSDIVTVSLANIFLENAGSLFHTELEDRFELEKGLHLSMGRDFSSNVIQLGLAMEHNFWERGVERNQYYCFNETTSDRSFNSFLRDAQFLIMGRSDFDRFNSTIDYAIESEQPDTGTSSVLCLSLLLYLEDLMLIGTDAGLFILDGVPGGITEPVLLDSELPEGVRAPIKSLSIAFGDVYAVATSGIYKLTIANRRVTDWERNPGLGLPSVINEIGGIGDLLIAATEDGMYFADDTTEPEFSEWFRASHVDLFRRTDLPLLGPATTVTVSNGIAFAGIGNEVYRSQDGRLWERVSQLSSSDDQVSDATAITSVDREGGANVIINRIIEFENNVYLATKNGLFNDEGSAKSDEVIFRLEPINGDDSEIPINDMTKFIGTSASELLVVGEDPNVFVFQSGSGSLGPLTPSDIQAGETTLWRKEKVADITAIDGIVALATGTRVVCSGRSLFFR
jgi:hypothetical protein